MSRAERAAGAIVGMAAGDALGAPYEFKPPFPEDFVPEMKAGGGLGWELGEWTDDTSMAIPILQTIADGRRLDDAEVLGDIVAAWAGWAREAKDVGIQTRRVLGFLTAHTEAAARESARAAQEAAGRSAGNGSLMRTAPVALAHLDDEQALAAAARRISDLTHYDEDNGDACVIWSAAIRYAILTGAFDVRRGVELLPEERRERWHGLLDEAERKQPRDFPKNGWVVQALQAAWSAISTTAIPTEMPAQHLRLALEAAVRGGNDTDTVAAIAGSLLGAKWGVSAVPADWRRKLHGWPGLKAPDLVRLAVLAARRGQPDSHGWPSSDHFTPVGADTLVPHPHDDGLYLGSLAALARLPKDIDAVVSLCRVGAKETDREHVQFWLIDEDDRNSNLHFVLRDAADTVAALRSEGKKVFLHCFEGRSRTPSVGALYSALHRGVSVRQAFAEVSGALPAAAPRHQFVRAAEAIVGGSKSEKLQ